MKVIHPYPLALAPLRVVSSAPSPPLSFLLPGGTAGRREDGLGGRLLLYILVVELVSLLWLDAVCYPRWVCWSRSLDFSGQIQSALVLLVAAACLWWQEMGWLVAWRSSISINKTGLSCSDPASGRDAGEVLTISFAELLWWKLMARWSATSSSDMRSALAAIHLFVLLLLLVDHGGRHARIWKQELAGGEEFGEDASTALLLLVIEAASSQVKTSSIEGGIVALYFSASWCPPCRKFTPKLIEAYKELASHGKSFEVVFVSGDQDEEAFSAYFAKMPWLAVPFSDSEGRKGLDERFEVRGIPHLVILDAKTGEVLTGDGVEFVSEYGIEAYPFTPERINELKEQEKAAKANQTIHSVLGTPDRDYVISNKGDKVPISDLEGKYVGVCFVVSGYGPVEEFTTVLAKIYEKLKEVGEKFEVVAISLDSDEASFTESFSSMPWLAIPQGDKKCQKLVSYFELNDLPTVVLIGPDGKTLNSNIADIIDEHGMDAWQGFPFNSEKLSILAEKAKAKAASQTLESLLVTGDSDFVIGKDGAKVPVSELVGKTVLLYFSAKWCGPCRAFLPTLVDVYNKIKEKNSDFEIVFVSSDRDQSSFDDFFSGMPWLALPLGDERKAYLSKMFKIRGIPSLVAIGPDGKTVNTDAKAPIAVHGAEAFPFTEERLQVLEKKIEEMAKGWPEKLKHELHEHELVLTRRPRPYGCDGCDEMGTSWSYACAECDFDLHTSCALGEKKGEDEKGQDAAEAAPAGYVCEGDVCRKA